MNGISPALAALAAEPFIIKEVVAERLGVHPDTVAKWAKMGRLPCYRFGRRVRFKWGEIERHIAKTGRHDVTAGGVR